MRNGLSQLCQYDSVAERLSTAAFIRTLSELDERLLERPLIALARES